MDVADPPVRVTEARKKEIFAELEAERKQRKALAQRGDEFTDLGMYGRNSEEKLKGIPSFVQHRSSASLVDSSPFSPRSPNSSTKSTRSVSFQSQVFMKTPKRTNATATRSSSKSKERDIERIQKEVEKAWTFTPEIHPGPKELGKSSFVRDKEELGRLSTPKTSIFQERDKAKKLQEDEMVRNCSFRPVISQYPIERKSSRKVDERLFQEASSLSKARRRLQSLHKESVAADCTFSPRVSSKGTPSPPIHKRLNTILQDRQDALDSLRKHISENERISTNFRPAISQISEKLARKDQKTLKKDVLHGIKTEEKFTRQKKIKIAQKSEEIDREKSTFYPETKMGNSGNWTSFLRREDEGEQKKALRLSLQDPDLDDECAFSTLIDPKSVHIPSKTASNGQFSLKKRVENRANLEPEQGKTVHHKVIQSSSSLHSFIPQTRLKSEGSEEAKTCFFRPGLWQSKYSSVKSEYRRQEDISGKIADHKTEKIRRLEEYRRIQEMEELGKCTFFPDTNHSPPRQSQSPPVVKGLETFYLHSDQARKLKTDLSYHDFRAKTDFSTYQKQSKSQSNASYAHIKSLRTAVLKQEMQSDSLVPRRVRS